MNRCLIFLFGVLGLIAPLAAQSKKGFVAPEGNPSPYLDPPAAAGFCDYVSGVAASQAAPLFGPVLFGSSGNTTAELLPSSISPFTSVANRTRFLSGGVWSVGNFERGLALKRVARAECQQYQVTAGLEAFLQDNSEALTSDALEARAQVLREALLHAKDILSRSAKLVAAHVSTTQEYHAMQIRSDELLQILEQTDSDMGRAAKSKSLEKLSLPELLKKQQDLLVRQEIEESKSREAGAWDISLHAGYQRILQAPQVNPYFGNVTLTFNVGRLWQGSAEKRARTGFQRWIQEDPTGPSVRTFILLEHLRAVQTAEAERLRQTDVLLDDLQQRLESVGGVGDERAQAYQDYVWFDYIKIKAEHAYLVAHLKDLSAVAGRTEP